MYNKLFTKILDSSIWLEGDSVRLVWITLLASMDEDGFCQFASTANLAQRAVVPRIAVDQAVAILEAPDPDSSDPENDGRRIERIPGGWMVLNAKKYRELVSREVAREKTRLRVQRFRDKKRPVTHANGSVTVHNVSVTPSEAVTDTEANTNTLASSDKSLPAIGTLPCLRGMWSFTQKDVDDWQEAYPGIDVLAELRKDREWLKANEKHRKTQKGMRRHVNAWLANAQNKSHPNGNGKGPEGHYERIHRQILEEERNQDPAE